MQLPSLEVLARRLEPVAVNLHLHLAYPFTIEVIKKHRDTAPRCEMVNSNAAHTVLVCAARVVARNATGYDKTFFTLPSAPPSK